jgi:hypothetical protein
MVDEIKNTREFFPVLKFFMSGVFTDAKTKINAQLPHTIAND